MSAKPLAAAAIAQLESDGVGTLIGTVINPAGLTHAKTVPLRRMAAYADPGLGASPVWHGFTVDQSGIVTSERIGAVGDRRIRIDLDALRILGDGLAWAPGVFHHQDGRPDALCARSTLAAVTQRLADAGYTAKFGHELEFVLVAADGAALESPLWAQYGLAGVLEHEGFVRDVVDAATASGVALEQLHPEYGRNQFELSLAPQPPVAAADQLVLMRIIVGRVARRYGLRVSLSPVPFAGAVGNGAHQHVSLMRGEEPVFTGQLDGIGGHAVAGLLAGLPGAQGVLSGSVLSGLRIRPGMWSGAHVCWGTENREAAVRFVAGGDANPHGANVEVKIVDPSANPYLASAVILGLALDGIQRSTPLPAETTVDPSGMSAADLDAAGIAVLPTAQDDILDALHASADIRAILGDDLVDAVVGVRRYEQQNYGSLPDDELAAKFRMAWSV